MKSSYMTRALKKSDKRYAHILGKLGYETRVMVAGEPVVVHPLDHDGNGHKGGSVAAPATEDLSGLRAEYQEVVGRRPFPGWGADELRQRIAAAQADD